MSRKQEFSREIRNGKVVYVPRARSPRSRVATQSQASQASEPSEPSEPSVVPPSRRGGCLAFGVIMGLGATMAGLIWLGIEFMVNPDVAFWLGQFLPQASTSPLTTSEQPQTLSQIRQHLQRRRQVPGKPVVLAADFNFNSPLRAATDVLIPISSSSCPDASCPQQITQLQVYRSLQLPYLIRLFQGKRYYRLLHQLKVQGPAESELRRLSRNPDVVSGSNHPLPLTRIERYEPAPKPGVWLRLTGLQSEGSVAAAFGQVLYFDANEARLSLMLTWLSPNGVLPAWQQVTGEGNPELVVDESVGLEPAFHHLSTSVCS